MRPSGDDLVAVVAAGAEQWLLVVDLDGGALYDLAGVAARAGEQVAELVADGERVQQQPPDGVRDPGLPGEGVADQLPGPAQQVSVMGTFP